MGFLDDSNFTTVDGKKEYTPIPEGEYTARITACPVDDSQGKENTKVKWEFSITDHPTLQNRKIWTSQGFKNAWSINKNLAAFGLKLTKEQSFQDILDMFQKLVNKDVKISVRHSTWRNDSNPTKLYYFVDIVSQIKSPTTTDTQDEIIW